MIVSQSRIRPGPWLVACLLAVFTSIHIANSAVAEDLEIDSDVLAAQAARVETMRRAAAATVSIFGLEGDGGGSGVLVSPDGYALTNYHVSSACGDHMRCGLNDGKLYDAVIVGIDATGDLSLIKLLGREDFPTAPLADSNQVQIGDWCFAAGNPFVLASNLQPTISLGLVSGVNRYQYPAGTLLEYADCIQTDAAINPGNSGGPLFNMRGEIIGINGRCSFEKRGRVNVGVGYAISANQAQYFLGVLKSGRLVDHATLGATVSTDGDGQVVVSNILSTSDAYRRGLRYGDIVVSLADREVSTTNTFKNILGTLPKGWRVPVTVRREGETVTMLIRLEGVHTDQELVQLISPERPGGPEIPDAPSLETEDESEEKSESKRERSPLEPNVELFESHYTKKRGYANFFFNQQAIDSLWSRVEAETPLGLPLTKWTLEGTLGGEKTPVKILLAENSATIEIGSRTTEVQFDQPISDVIAARRESSLLICLRGLREFLAQGPNKLGDSVYLGEYPVYTSASRKLAEQPLQHVVRTLWYDGQLRSSLPTESGLISLIEVFGDEEDDPAELYLNDYREVEVDGESIPFPHLLRLQFGDEPVALVQLESITIDSQQAENQTTSSETEQ